MSSIREELRMLALSMYLDMHATVMAKLKMSGKLTAQNEQDYMIFCEQIHLLYEKHGLGFYKHIDEAVPDNTWLPLCRNNIDIVSLEEMNKASRH